MLSVFCIHSIARKYFPWRRWLSQECALPGKVHISVMEKREMIIHKKITWMEWLAILISTYLLSGCLASTKFSPDELKSHAVVRPSFGNSSMISRIDNEGHSSLAGKPVLVRAGKHDIEVMTCAGGIGCTRYSFKFNAAAGYEYVIESAYIIKVYNSLSNDKPIDTLVERGNRFFIPAIR